MKNLSDNLSSDVPDSCTKDEIIIEIEEETDVQYFCNQLAASKDNPHTIIHEWMDAENSELQE